MLSVIYLCFGWLPLALRILVNTIISIAILILGMRLLNLVWDVISIFFNFFGGLLSRVVAFFV